ncbi:PRC-barrel domain-containing protein [Methanobrevibacter sp.]|uniref:PRC-barrel domain-containing protein n=1 Tax=Methanobrevibacter sp. TaxID=66852 RepID=UPI00386E2FDC
MKIRQLLGKTVLDKNAFEVGKVDDVDFDPESGKITGLTLALQKNIFSKDVSGVLFDDVATIGEFIILSKEIPKKDEETAEETEEE